MVRFQYNCGNKVTWLLHVFPSHSNRVEWRCVVLLTRNSKTIIKLWGQNNFTLTNRFIDFIMHMYAKSRLYILAVWVADNSMRRNYNEEENCNKDYVIYTP